LSRYFDVSRYLNSIYRKQSLTHVITKACIGFRSVSFRINC